jgi:putative spermidine/putrescine transport system substrate-binding protein
MNRRMTLCMVVALAALMVLPAIGADKINLYTNGSDNVRISWEALIDAFNKTNPGFTVVQQYMPSGAGDRTDRDKIIAAYKAGAKDIDIDIFADIDENQLTRIKNEAGPDALAKLDVAKIPNMAGVQARSVVLPDRAIPFRGTAVFIAYNADKVANPPKTTKDLYAWIKANPGKFAYNDPSTGGAGSSFVTTTVYNLMPAEALTSTDEKWMSQWDAGFKQLADLHPYLYKASGKVQYTVKNQGSLDLLASGTIVMCPAWADMTLDQKSRKLLPASIKLQQLDPPLTGNVTMCSVPAMSKYIPLACKFLNFTVSAQGQDILVQVMKAIPLIDTTKLPAATLDLLSGLQMKTYRTATLGALGTKLNERWTKEIATLP